MRVKAKPVALVKGIVAEGGFAGAVLGDGNKISATVADAESYLNKFTNKL